MTSMTLVQKQQKFTQLVAELLKQAARMGYGVTLGECYRPAFTAQHYAEGGEGIKNSLHCMRLAIDIMLFKDGLYLRENNDYRPLGEWWAGLSQLGEFTLCWGGEFGDGNHFSIEHNGIK